MPKRNEHENEQDLALALKVPIPKKLLTQVPFQKNFSALVKVPKSKATVMPQPAKLVLLPDGANGVNALNATLMATPLQNENDHDFVSVLTA